MALPGERERERWPVSPCLKGTYGKVGGLGPSNGAWLGWDQEISTHARRGLSENRPDPERGVTTPKPAAAEGEAL